MPSGMRGAGVADSAWETIGGMAGEDSITVAVRVHPGAAREGLALLPDGSLDVRLRARPVEGQANARLVEVLADRLGLRRRDVVVVSGVRSRQKLVRIGLRSAEELGRRLGAGAPSMGAGERA